MPKKTDRHGLWVWRIIKRWEKLIVFKDNLHNRLLAFFWGIKLGSNILFFGKTYFSRAFNSEINIGENCQFRSAPWSNKVGINRNCMISTLQPQAKIIIGKRVGFSGIVIAAAESITIGDDVLCGANVTINDTDWHGIEPENRHTFGKSAPVIIENNVWLGMNVVVMKGVTIGKGSLIGAGSIVTRSIPPGTIAVGQPARVIREFNPCNHLKNTQQ